MLMLSNYTSCRVFIRKFQYIFSTWALRVKILVEYKYHSETIREGEKTLFGFTFAGEKIDSKSCGVDFDMF